jgi:uncharacterized protein YjeT (DUF2065 family)
MKHAFFAAVALGFLLLVLSGLWTTLFPGTSSWTPEKSAQWTKIKDRIHTLGFVVNNPSVQVSMHSGPETGQAKAEYDRLKTEHNALSAEFASIHDRPYTIAAILKWSGIALALVGVIGWYALNQSR